MKRSKLCLAVILAASTMAVAACSSGSAASGKNSASGQTITVWSEENDPDRVATTQAIAAQFTKATGIKVKIVGIAEDQFHQLITSDAAAGKLPDVVGALPLDAVQFMASNGLVDTDATSAAIGDLGASTFAPSALKLTQYQGKQVAVPSDAWVQLLLYRKDLFDKLGLAAPTSYAAITAAAQKLQQTGIAGISMANVANDAFTEQTFEYLALANNCQMVDAQGNIQLTSKACEDSFSFYTDLIRQDSMPGTQDVDTTRASYFAGKAGMTIWSSYILDEMAGLRKDAMPSCAQCKSDPAYLAENSGIVTALQGPDGSAPANFGEINSWTITSGGSSAAAQKFVEYMLSTGYTDWLGMAPEGKVPVRAGDASDPKKFLDAWGGLKTGVDTKAALSKFYPASVLDSLETSPATIARWGIPEGQGALVAATIGDLPVPAALNAASSGSLSASAAAAQAQAAVQKIKSSLQ